MTRLLSDRTQRRRRIADDLREQHAERVDVGARIDHARELLLRRHESRRTDHGGVGIRATVLGDAPVHHVDLAESADHHVLGLEIAMHDTVGVREGHRVENAAERNQANVDGCAVANHLVQPTALHELHHIEGAAVGKRACVVHRDDARVIQPGQDVRFALQPHRARSLLIGDVEDLDRDSAIQDVIPRHVHGAHAAMAGDTGDLVARVQLGPRRRFAKTINRAVRDHRPALSEPSGRVRPDGASKGQAASPPPLPTPLRLTSARAAARGR